MQRTRSWLVCPLLAAGIALPIPQVASASTQQALPLPSLTRKASGGLGSSAVGDPDTVWIGHVYATTGLPGTPGGYGPYHIGRGGNRPNPLGSPSADNNGYWDFDRFNVAETDSLQGWWPVPLPYRSTGAKPATEFQRPFFAFDYGNVGNYTINQGSPKRTFGVISYWHRDHGSLVAPVPISTGTNPAPLTWLPFGGTGASAWCGLRSHGDGAYVDPITGNPFNQSVLERGGSNSLLEFGSFCPGTDSNFPGYGSQWDQMLYRDFTVAGGLPFYPLAFDWTTNMSLGLLPGLNRQTGWFDLDPLKPPVAGDGNYIPWASAVDVFRVYIGAPVRDGLPFRASDGFIYDVSDPQRRWFSEVIDIGKPYGAILTAAGIAVGPFGPGLPGGPGSLVQNILDAQGTPAGGTIRLVFRIKTNRGFDDQDNCLSGFSSMTAGAAIVDNVAFAGTFSDFENPASINNSPAVPTSSAWKSTGKPPGTYFHLHGLSDIGSPLPFDDVIGSPTRMCNMLHTVALGGSHDAAEKPGGYFGTNDQDRQHGFMSPTINLVSAGPGAYNAMGIDTEIAARNVIVAFDLYGKVFTNLQVTGNAFRIGWQSYPVTQPNGVRCWSDIVKPNILTETGDLGCISIDGSGVAGADGSVQGLIVTSNASGVPDSLRCLIEHVTRCYSMPITAMNCSPDGSSLLSGGYFDNISIGFARPPVPGLLVSGIESAGAAGPLAVNFQELFNDAFPANSVIMPNTAGFDTLAAQVKTGLNTAQGTGDLMRHNIPGDSIVVRAPGPNVRVDLVFRILPGVGNYLTLGSPASGLRKSPDAGGDVGNAVTSGDASFWGQYLADNGAFGTGGDGISGPGHFGGSWDKNAWNSARMDTAETNLFPTKGAHPNLGRMAHGLYASTYHEADPKYSTLGIVKNRCFLIAVTPGSAVEAANITCGAGTYPPSWTTGSQTGFNPVEIPGQPGRTREYTKIIPDGQLTPGAHVEYFLRKSAVSSPLVFSMTPDTNFVLPQPGESNWDGHRWQQFGVLPNRWKDQAFGGPGMACMLVVDLGDRRGDELVWALVGDATGITTSSQRGAHNGWKAPTLTLPYPSILQRDVGADDAVSVRAHLGQPGTVWDLYQVKGGEAMDASGHLASRQASQVNPGLASGKFSTLGPSPNVLRSYYQSLVLLGADLGAGRLGPVPDQSDDDIGLLTDFLHNAAGRPLPRGVIAQGRNLVEGQNHPTLGHPSFFSTEFRASLVAPNYRVFESDLGAVSDLVTAPPLTGTTFGVSNWPAIGNDVLASGGGGSVAAQYVPVGGGSPGDASIYAAEGSGHPSRTLVNGWTLGLSSGFPAGQGSRYLVTPGGTYTLWLSTIVNIFGALSCGPTAPPVAVGDQPGSPAAGMLGLWSPNPTSKAKTLVAFRLGRTERVRISLVDVSGRVVRELADRVFEGGVSHELRWDGRDASGQEVPRGVYFYRLRSSSFSDTKKIVILRP